MLKQGIILIATGHPNYGNMAYNLALTIKAANRETQVAVVYSGVSLSHLNISQQDVFDNKIKLPENYRDGFGAKLHLDQLTPFDKTIYLDVDMLWLGMNPKILFDSLEGSGFKTITEGDSNNPSNKYYFWADEKEIKQAYEIPLVYQIRSEFIYFEKGTKVFIQARKLKPELKLKTIRMFGDHIPDELYFNIATGVLNLDPSLGFMPAYWARLHNELMPKLSELFGEYYLLSFGSNTVSPVMKKTYDTVMQVCCNKLGLPYLFKLQSKKEWAIGRQKI
jgi:hypothetical protein